MQLPIAGRLVDDAAGHEPAAARNRARSHPLNRLDESALEFF
jgi:hypothetical protein